jgi:FkbM family methyltransferase
MRVEIGTSDFRTEAGVEEGLFIEPSPYYFNRLPDCNKLNIAISDYNGYDYIYYLTDSEIDRYALPNWIRGCNSIGSIHPTVENILKDRGIPLNTVMISKIEVRRIKDVLKEQKIENIDFLKIDTEGHDHVILKDFLDTCDIQPNKIQFEYNSLSNSEALEELIEILEIMNYRITRLKDDVVCERLFQ